MNKKAAALAYDKYKDNSPKVVASGKGLIAQNIINRAKELDIPLFVNEVLVDSLVKMEVDVNVPYELYEAVVEVFIWLQDIEGSAKFSKNIHGP